MWQAPKTCPVQAFRSQQESGISRERPLLPRQHIPGQVLQNATAAHIRGHKANRLGFPVPRFPAHRNSLQGIPNGRSNPLWRPLVERGQLLGSFQRNRKESVGHACIVQPSTLEQSDLHDPECHMCLAYQSYEKCFLHYSKGAAAGLAAPRPPR